MCGMLSLNLWFMKAEKKRERERKKNHMPKTTKSNQANLKFIENFLLLKRLMQSNQSKIAKRIKTITWHGKMYKNLLTLRFSSCSFLLLLIFTHSSLIANLSLSRLLKLLPVDSLVSCYCNRFRC